MQRIKINFVIGMLLPDITRENKHGRLKLQIYGTIKLQTDEIYIRENI